MNKRWLEEEGLRSVIRLSSWNGFLWALEIAFLLSGVLIYAGWEAGILFLGRGEWFRTLTIVGPLSIAATVMFCRALILRRIRRIVEWGRVYNT